MGQGPEQTLIRGGYKINQQVHEKMLTISSSQRNANQNHPKIPSHERPPKRRYFLSGETRSQGSARPRCSDAISKRFIQALGYPGRQAAWDLRAPGLFQGVYIGLASGSGGTEARCLVTGFSLAHEQSPGSHRGHLVVFPGTAGGYMFVHCLLNHILGTSCFARYSWAKWLTTDILA